jgi:hypothetical protein
MNGERARQVFLQARPERILTWTGPDEIERRTVMPTETWL